MHLLRLALAALVLSTSAALAQGVPLYNVTVTGAVQTQVPGPGGSVKIKSTPITNNGLFSVFGLSKADYLLVLDPNGAGELCFVAKSAMNPVQRVQVFLLNSTLALVKADSATASKQTFALVSNVGSTSTGTVFEALSGKGSGPLALTGIGGSSTSVKSFAFSWVGTGKDPAPQSTTSTALLKVKFVLGKAVATAPRPAAAGSVLGVPLE